MCVRTRVIVQGCVYACACMNVFLNYLCQKYIYIQYNTVYNILRRKENRKIWLLYKIAGKENGSKMCTRKTVTSRVECWPRLMPNPQAKSRP